MGLSRLISRAMLVYMHTVVLDTNVLIDGAQDEHSASWTIIEQVLDGKLAALMSHPLRGEYQLLLNRTVPDSAYHRRMTAFLREAAMVQLGHIPHVVLDDAEDDKVLATAVQGGADALVTSDKHLLTLDPYHDIRILTPQAFRNLHAEDSDTAWSDFARMIGIGPK